MDEEVSAEFESTPSGRRRRRCVLKEVLAERGEVLARVSTTKTTREEERAP